MGKRPVEVRVGSYVNRIGEFDIRGGGWTANFDIWFRLIEPGGKGAVPVVTIPTG